LMVFLGVLSVKSVSIHSESNETIDESASAKKMISIDISAT